MARRAAVLLALLSLWGGQAGAQVATTAATAPLALTYKLGVAGHGEFSVSMVRRQPSAPSSIMW